MQKFYIPVGAEQNPDNLLVFFDKTKHIQQGDYFRFCVNLQCRVQSRDAIRDTIERYVNFYNKQRPCYAIGYDTPNHYYQRYQRGELERKDTFSKRVLTAEPKFLQKRRRQKLKEKENQGVESAQDTVSTSENGNE